MGPRWACRGRLPKWAASIRLHTLPFSVLLCWCTCVCGGGALTCPSFWLLGGVSPGEAPAENREAGAVLLLLPECPPAAWQCLGSSARAGLLLGGESVPAPGPQPPLALVRALQRLTHLPWDGARGLPGGHSCGRVCGMFQKWRKAPWLVCRGRQRGAVLRAACCRSCPRFCPQQVGAAPAPKSRSLPCLLTPSQARSPCCPWCRPGPCPPPWGGK